MTDLTDNYLLQAYAMAYEGASTNYKSELRGLVNGDTDTLIARELCILQKRSAHIIRNNGLAAAAFNRYVTNLKAIKVNWRTPDNEKHVEMQKYWDDFIVDCSYDGCGDFNTIQAIWNGANFTYGAAFTRMMYKRSYSTPIPLKLQPIPTEHFNPFSTKTLTNGNILRYGIEFANQIPVNYYFKQDTTYYSYIDAQNPNLDVVIPSDEILHILIRKYPGQWLGEPMLAPIILTLYEIDELIDATIAKQKAAQVISWVIEKTGMTTQLPFGVSEKIFDKDNKGRDIEKLIFSAKGTNVLYPEKGETVKFHQSGDIGNNLGDLIKSEWQKIAAALSLPYFQISGDLSDLDFSSIRAALIELRYRLEFIQNFYLIPMGLRPLTRKIQEILSVKGKIPLDSARPHFQLPRWYGVDELKDAQADVLELENGLTTMQRILDERDLTFEEIIADRKKLEGTSLAHILVPKSSSTAQSNNTHANINSVAG